MKVTCITPTGGRPAAFRLCEKWMSRQTRLPDQWIVVDDVHPATECRMGQEAYYPEPRWQPGQQSTQARNLLAGLAAVRGDVVLIIEDDDWYAPNYIEAMAQHLETHELVGERFGRYYNVATRRGRRMGNLRHACLCATGFQSSLIPRVQLVCRGARQFIDIGLWGLDGMRSLLIDTEDHRPLTVGIKGLPGRPGIGVGHRDDFGEPDPTGTLLRSWIGEDAQTYLEQEWRATPVAPLPSPSTTGRGARA